MRPFVVSMRAIVPAVFLVVALTSAVQLGRSTGSGEALQAELLPSPAGPWSAQPTLSRGRDQSVLMVWLERPQGEPSTIKFSRYNGASWSTPRVIASSPAIIANPTDVPSLIELPSGTLVAHWQQSSPTDRNSYGVRVSRSSDGGATWSVPVTPHVSHESGENGFVSFFPAGGDSVGVVWLDGRNFAQGRSETMLMSTTIARDGRIAAERTLDARVCDCCHTAFAATPSGGILVYRDRSADNVRDIAFSRSSRGTWSTSASVYADGWVTPSCPVNGPSVDAVGEASAVAWFTNARDTSKVLVSFSGGAGGGYSRPVRADLGSPVGRAKVVITQPNVAWVSWLERATGGARLMVRRVTSAGVLSAPLELAPEPMTLATGFPQMVGRQGELVVAWSVPAAAGSPPSVRVARARLAER